MKDSFSKAMLAGAAFAALFAAHPASAGDGYPYDEPAASAPTGSWLGGGAVKAFPGGRVRPVWGFESGTRMWFSSGSYGYKLYDVPGSPQLSQLDFTGLAAQTAEIYARFDAGNGFFVKGYAGGGSVSSGKLSDKDFPPVVSPVSDTASSIDRGDVRYLTVDAGYEAFARGPFRLGAFVGYGYWNERLNAFGCAQAGGNPAICGGAGIAGAVDVLDADPHWNMLRIGAAGTWEFVPGFKIDLDAAYVRGYLGGSDYHNLRPDIRNAPVSGSGNGLMVDAILSWQATEALSFGVGGRWWHLESDGEFRFDKTAVGAFGASAQPLKVEQDRYGLLLQAGYKFGVDGSARPDAWADVAPRPTWVGPYVGFNAGYGFGTDRTSATGTMVGNGYMPATTDTRRGGVGAGVAVGWGWQTGKMVYGIEADAGYANISGSAADTRVVPSGAGFAGVTTTVESDISWLATVRGRIGHAFTQNVLVFLTGGGAFGGVEAKTDVRETTTNPCAMMLVCASGSTSKTAVGWTAGGGLEYAINGWASVKTEYLHVDLGRVGVTATDPASGAAFDASTKVTTDVVRSGLNLKF